MPPENLKVVVGFTNGTSLVFAGSDGEDLGDFPGPGFTQRCVRVTNPSSALTVYFRPDRTSNRVEVVFELGRLWGQANANAANLGAYTARISNGNTLLAQVNVPKHWWFSRWRWQSSPRPVINKPADLPDGLIPLAFDKPLLAYVPKPSAVKYKGPMDTAGVQPAMPMVGDRPDIGPFTEWQAYYLATGDQTALASVLAQAEAAGSAPWHMRDEVTGAPVSVYDYPTINWTLTPAMKNGWVKRTTTDWKVDSAHQPALSYLPYLLTGDPYFLEELQYQSTWDICYHLSDRLREKLPILYEGEIRAYAWGLRNLSQNARVNPTTTPKWLLPRTYFKRVLGDNLTYFTRKYVNGTDPAIKELRAFWNVTLRNNGCNFVDGWQEDYLSFVMGWTVRLGFVEWTPAYVWQIGGTLARTTGAGGWPRQFCTPYEIPLFKKNGSPITTWADAWQATKALPTNAYHDPLPTGPVFAQQKWWGYQYYTQCALALAVHLGYKEAQEPYTFVRAMTVHGLTVRPIRGTMEARWAFQP